MDIQKLLQVLKLSNFLSCQGTPSSARHFPFWVIFAPVLLIQGTGVLFATHRLVEKISLLVHGEAAFGRYWNIASKACDILAFLQHGSRVLCWWLIDEGSREELAGLLCGGFWIWRLQATLSEQTEMTKITQQEFERLQNIKILCRACFEEEISVGLLPCGHHFLCSTCCEKCKKCPICRIYIEDQLLIYDV